MKENDTEGAPDLIYLQWSDVDDYTGDGAITWCADKINSDDVQYVRAALVISILEQAPGCKKAAEIVRAALGESEAK